MFIQIFLFYSFLNKHDFDGFEADWEYPGIRGGQTDDKYYLTLFFQVRYFEGIEQGGNMNILQEFKEAAMAQSIVTGQRRLIIAAAVAANQDIVSDAYEIDKISK